MFKFHITSSLIQLIDNHVLALGTVEVSYSLLLNTIELRIACIVRLGRRGWIFRQLAPPGVAEGLYKTNCIMVRTAADVKRNCLAGAGLAISLEACKRQKVYPQVHNSQTIQKVPAIESGFFLTRL